MWEGKSYAGDPVAEGNACKTRWEREKASGDPRDRKWSMGLRRGVKKPLGGPGAGGSGLC